MPYSRKDLEEMPYKKLQKLAKEEGVKANGRQEVIVKRLWNEINESDFGNIRKNIEDKLQREQNPKGDASRVKTGIDGLDNIMNGGIPRNNLVLVSGGPGTGKTTLGLQFILEGIRNGETAVYVNMDERKENIIRNAEIFGWNLPEYMQQDKLHFVRPRIYEFDKAKKQIDNIASRFDADRIVVDSLSVIGSAIESEAKMRRGLMELNQRFNRLNTTTLTISEVGSEQDNSRYGVEEFSADGIIRLYYSRIGGSFQRGVTIRKMRGSDHSNDIHPLEIGTEGVQVWPNEEVFSDL